MIVLLLQPQQPKLVGTYRTEFEKKYQQQTYQLILKDSVFTKRWPDAVTSKGKIKYEKFTALLKGKPEDDPIEIDARDFGKDTMAFTTRGRSDQSKVTGRGKLIRVK